MLFNLNGKFKYASKIISSYSEWWLVFLARFNNRPLRKIKLRNGLTMVGGSKSLIIDLVDEIFVNEIYNPQFFKIRQGDTVIDIGANIGAFSLYAAKHGAKKIYSVEPFSENINFIKKNFQFNKIETPTIIEKAVSSKNGTARLYLGDLDSHGLLFNHSHKQIFSTYRIVETTKLSKILDVNKIAKVNFLKIDCEGSEGQIILSTEKRYWENIERVAIEYHNNVSILNNKEISRRLEDFGYKTKTHESDNIFGYIYAWR